MRAAVFHGIADLRVENRPIPQPGPGQVRLRVALAGVCSTDAHILHGQFAVRPPRVLGHELVGEVDAIGPGVAQSWLGRACAVSPARFCGVCTACRRGAPELCENFSCLGNTHDGGFAEFTLVEPDQLIPLDGLEPEQAVWLEPLACVVHACQALDLQAEACVLVLGAGTLGRLLGRVLKIAHRAQVAFVDPNPDKIERVLAEGADAAWAVPRSGPAPAVEAQLEAWIPGGPPAIVDTSGAAAAIERAAGWAGPRGRIVLFGVSSPEARISLSPAAVYARELTLTATAGMTPETIRRAETLLRSGELSLAGLASHTVGLDELPGVLLDKRARAAGKVLVAPGGKRF